MQALETALQVAMDAHVGQTDLAGQPYILHPLRVMHAVSAWGERAQVVALLHDVVEDCPVDWPMERVVEFCHLGPAELAALQAITKKPRERYRIYLDRVDRNQLARIVKLADLRDNMDITRLRLEQLQGSSAPSYFTPKVIKRLEKYLDAWGYLSVGHVKPPAPCA